jgi:hypothetical protein
VDSRHIWEGYGFLPTRVKPGSSSGGTVSVSGSANGQNIDVNIPGLLAAICPQEIASVAVSTAGLLLSLNAASFQWELADASLALFADAYAAAPAAMGAELVGLNIWGVPFTPVLVSGSFSPGPVYLATAGKVTQTRPTSGYLQIVGKAASSTTMLWQPQNWMRLT